MIINTNDYIKIKTEYVLKLVEYIIDNVNDNGFINEEHKILKELRPIISSSVYHNKYLLINIS
mgnify:CR=1 FL=1